MTRIDINDPLVQIQITVGICGFVAVVTTIYRVYLRRTRLWYDDGWAVFSLLTLFLFMTTIFLHVVPNPAFLSKVNKIATYYIAACTFYTVIWSARLSILFSIIRIDTDLIRRKRMLFVAVVFFLVCMILMGQIFWICEHEPRWKDTKNPQCNLGKQTAIFQLVSDTIADTILLVAPLRLLAVLIETGLRRRLMIIFSTCIVTTVVSLVHAAYIIRNGGPKIVVAAVVENCMSLIVCNVPVVFSAIYYRCQRADSAPSAERFAVPIFIMKFAKRNRKESTAMTTMTCDIGVTTITQEVSVSPKQDQWTFMDEADYERLDIAPQKVSQIV